MNTIVDVAPLRDHPAKFNDDILDRIGLYVGALRRVRRRPLEILDPFAGVGRIHDLPKRLGRTMGVELEPEWAACREGTIVGDATKLPKQWTHTFDVVATSPCYGNRMADSHEARDSCYTCKGTGVTLTEAGCGDAPWQCQWCGVECVCGELAAGLRKHNTSCPNCRTLRCPSCHGTGLSRRHTYRHVLGRVPSSGSTATLHWGGLYRALHEDAWTEARRVLLPGGLMLVNIKNHIRDHVEQPVVEWHEQCLVDLGFRHIDTAVIPARGIRHGENHGTRIDHECLIVARSPR